MQRGLAEGMAFPAASRVAQCSKHPNVQENEGGAHPWKAKAPRHLLGYFSRVQRTSGHGTAWMRIAMDGDGGMRCWSMLGYSFAGPLGSPASAWPLSAPKASWSVRNAPADTAQMLKQSLSGMEAVWTSESGTCGTLSLLSQFQALAPNWRLMNGLKNKLHFPGAEGVADPLLPLRFPSSCLSRLLGEAGCPIPLGAGFSRVSFSRCCSFWGATDFGEVMGCLHEGVHLASPACV